MKVNIPVVGKFICKAVISPVAITEKNNFRGIVEWYLLRFSIGPAEAGI
jgi:hypothetical protein